MQKYLHLPERVIVPDVVVVVEELYGLLVEPTLGLVSKAAGDVGGLPDLAGHHQAHPRQPGGDQEQEEQGTQHPPDEPTLLLFLNPFLSQTHVMVLHSGSVKRN